MGNLIMFALLGAALGLLLGARKRFSLGHILSLGVIYGAATASAYALLVAAIILIKP